MFDKITDFGPWDRCLTRGMPGSMLTGAYNMGIRVMQSPGLVVIPIEMVHETRKIYLDGRPAPPPEVTEYLGYSRGHWEGDTLVVETVQVQMPFTYFHGAPSLSEEAVYRERIRQEGDHIVLIIADDGRGFDVAALQGQAGHLGIVAMRERLGSTQAVRLPMTRRDIANYLRLATETVCRVLTRFESRQWLISQDKTVRLLQPEALAAVAAVVGLVPGPAPQARAA